MFQPTTFSIVTLTAVLAMQLQCSEVRVNEEHVLVIDGKKVFPIGFTMPPPVDGKAPNGKNAIAELADAGATFLRTGPFGGDWDENGFKQAKRSFDVAAKYKMYEWLWLREASSADSPQHEALLKKIVMQFKDHPAMGVWKGADEPEWGKHPVPPLERAYQTVKSLDPQHPVAIIQAPRGSVESLQRYNATYDILGTDIYPVSYPPGSHSGLTNKQINVVGDYTKRMWEVLQADRSGAPKSVWMTLQIFWSGVNPPAKTLRFPTFPEERFMTYDAIINGARGLVYFGGSGTNGMSAADRKLGWNWTFWNNVLRRVVLEIGSKSPLYPALLAPDSKLPVQVNKPGDIEFCVREVDNHIFVIAAKRTDATTLQVEFSGLPESATGGPLLFEEPRVVNLKSGKFNDWFGPFEVHVYRFEKSR